MQLTGQILDLIPADAAGWMGVVAGMAAFALLLRLDQNRKERRAGAKVAAPPNNEGVGSKLPPMVGVLLQELKRAPHLTTLQTRASHQTDSAEYEFNRLVADCAAVMSIAVVPTMEILQHLPKEPAAAPAQQQPLAA